MIHKLLFSFLLTTTLLTSVDSCFAMDPPEDEIQLKLRKSPTEVEELKEKLAKIEHINAKIKHTDKILLKINRLEENLDSKHGKEKIENYNEIIKGLEELLESAEEVGEEVYNREDCLKFRSRLAAKTRDKGVEFFNYYTLLDPHLEQCIKFLKKSYTMNETICHPDEVPLSLKQIHIDDLMHVACHLHSLSEPLIGSEDASKDYLKILNLLSSALECTEDAYKIFSREEQGSNQKTNSLEFQEHEEKMRSIRTSLFQVSTEIYQNTLFNESPSTSPTFKSCDILVKKAAIVEKTISLIMTHFIKSPLKFEVREQPEYSPEGKKLLSITNMPNTNGVGSSLQGFESTYFYTNISLHLCSFQKRISDSFANLKTPNIELQKMFTEKSQHFLNAAIAAYKHSCPASYKNDNNYIHASLEGLIGNEQPLKEFYAQRRKERKEQRERAIAQAILLQKTEVKTQKEANEREKKLRKDNSDQKRLGQKINIESEVLVPSSSIEPMIKPTPGKEEMKEPVKKEKVKTRRPADPSRAKSQPKKASPTVDTIEQDNTTRFISPKNYQVFLVLIGESPKRNISLDQVIKLLDKGLKCTITHAATGSHGKATDPNTQAMWTIPPAWNGPIPPFYRLQLMEFLLDLMELNPDDVQPEKR